MEVVEEEEEAEEEEGEEEGLACREECSRCRRERGCPREKEGGKEGGVGEFLLLVGQEKFPSLQRVDLRD